MPKNKRLTKSERRAITAARRQLRDENVRDSVEVRKQLRRVSR